MLTAKNNELLCRVGPSTPLGAMFREYWWPVLRSERLQRDGAPVKVRLLGENYVAFRATDGRVGVLDQRCPHRGVSLLLARNEGCALRCILHGWKIDVSGKVVETPNEKEQGARLAKLKVRHLPVHEAAGLVWVWAGQGLAPAFPQYAFTAAHEAYPIMGYYNCNWLQLIETLWDPTHVQILHAEGDSFRSQWEGLGDVGLAHKPAQLYTAGMQSRDDACGFSYRFLEGVGAGGGLRVWIPTVMPSWVYITSFAENPFGDRVVLGHIPIDDEHTILIQVSYNMTKPISEMGQRLQIGMTDPDNFVPDSSRRETNWNQDREAMTRSSFSGIGGMHDYARGILLQDQAALESLGSIADRTQEQIGPADHAIVKGRQVYLDAVRAHMAGKPALGIAQDFSLVGRERGIEYEDAA
jgi:phthalate 4,5-dioxygenase oxygenase subunit